MYNPVKSTNYFIHPENVKDVQDHTGHNPCYLRPDAQTDITLCAKRGKDLRVVAWYHSDSDEEEDKSHN